LKKQWIENYSGLTNAHKTAILEEGMEYKAVTMPLKDTQFLEGRAFQATEIASAFGVPPTMIGLKDGTTAWGTGIEQIMLGFLIFSLTPRMKRIEQAMMRKLLTDKEKKEFYIKFNANALLRGDTKARFEGYQLARQNGWLSTNDIRALEDLDPVENGDIYWRPANMAPADAPYDPKAAADDADKKTK
jgi:HK97 family phage portal protein